MKYTWPVRRSILDDFLYRPISSGKQYSCTSRSKNRPCVQCAMRPLQGLTFQHVGDLSHWKNVLVSQFCIFCPERRVTIGLKPCFLPLFVETMDCKAFHTAVFNGLSFARCSEWVSSRHCMPKCGLFWRLKVGPRAAYWWFFSYKVPSTRREGHFLLCKPFLKVLGWPKWRVRQFLDFVLMNVHHQNWVPYKKRSKCPRWAQRIVPTVIKLNLNYICGY